MSDYPPQLSVKEAMNSYFKKFNLGEDGGLNKTWAKIKVGPIYLPLLNIPARRKALVLHDIHHIVTGYSGAWQGEVSISSWEISTGCGKYWVAWVLDISGMGIGLFLYPKSVFKAFIRGQRSKNLYMNSISKEEALGMKIEDLQHSLLLDKEITGKPTQKEILGFVAYSFFALLSVLPFIAIPAIILWFILK